MSATSTSSVAAKQPPTINILKSLSLLPQMARNPIPVFTKYTEENGGTFRMRGGAGSVIVSSQPEFMRHVLQTNNKNYHKSAAQTEGLGRFLGQGLLTSNGDYWLRQRRLIQPGFHKKKLMGLSDIMLHEMQDFEKNFHAAIAANEPIEFTESMLHLSYKLVSHSLFGTGVPDEKLERIRYIIDHLQEYAVKIIRQPFRRPYYLMTGIDRKHQQLKKEADKIVLEVINNRRLSKERHDDLLDMLLDIRYEDTGEGMTDEQLKDESMILFVAGHETTANALSWTFYLLDQHPRVVEKILAEVKEVVGDQAMTFDHLMQLPYTRQVVEESMRLYPPAWATDRLALDDDVVNGYEVAKGSVVLLYIRGAHHSEKYWEEPLAFRPERFEKEAKKNHHKYAYLPFGGGPRLCIGNNFAMMEMQMALAYFLPRFKFEVMPNQVIVEQPLITLNPKNGIKMKVKRRTS